MVINHEREEPQLSPRGASEGSWGRDLPKYRPETESLCVLSPCVSPEWSPIPATLWVSISFYKGGNGKIFSINVILSGGTLSACSRCAIASRIVPVKRRITKRFISETCQL